MAAPANPMANTDLLFASAIRAMLKNVTLPRDTAISLKQMNSATPLSFALSIVSVKNGMCTMAIASPVRNDRV